MVSNHTTLWVRFEEEDRYTPAPDFCLPADDRMTVCLRDFRGDCKLLVYFPSEQDTEGARHVLEGFLKRLPELLAEETRLIIIHSGKNGEIIPTPGRAGSSLIYLEDQTGSVKGNYAGLMDSSLVQPGDGMLYVLDQYGAPYTAVVRPEREGDSLFGDVLKWLEFIAVQCPE
jgi:hypothetical protein